MSKHEKEDRANVWLEGFYWGTKIRDTAISIFWASVFLAFVVAGYLLAAPLIAYSWRYWRETWGL